MEAISNNGLGLGLEREVLFVLERKLLLVLGTGGGEGWTHALNMSSSHVCGCDVRSAGRRSERYAPESL